MRTVKSEAFAVWITGLPASGKSTLTRVLVEKLEGRGMEVAVLESDVLRKVLAPRPSYAEADREAFYRGMVWIGALLVRYGVPVIFDATANRRAYRDRARSEIRRFMEVHLDSPLKVCMERDPKGIYRQGREAQGGTVPGLQVPYEAPLDPDVHIPGEVAPAEAADRVLAGMVARGFVEAEG